ncbi:UPAR/Ly6 domain-containing protein bou isoform X1 [Dermacentor albipictus]|uniref:UPAR/Ly6 domain-containing protein bou isoform X1 n=1 Tax=Dermacentor albipictus TaxID=60249 RepID=UPI0038FC0F09
MASMWWLLVTVAAVISSFLASVEAIYCHQCDSNQHLHCSELWDHSSSPEPTSCDNLYEANYCIKATGMYGGRIGTFRFCSSRDRGHYCDYVKRPGDDREYRACIYTCSGLARRSRRRMDRLTRRMSAPLTDPEPKSQSILPVAPDQPRCQVALAAPHSFRFCGE